MGLGKTIQVLALLLQCKEQAQKKIAQLQKQGRKISPVVIDGRTLATTFLGRASCENLQAYSDFSSRFPRGRTYVRKGSVVDVHPIAKDAWLRKHLAAVLYGVGARLDLQPELLFVLRGVDKLDLVAATGSGALLGSAVASLDLDDERLAGIFGTDLDAGHRSAEAAPAKPPKRTRKAKVARAAQVPLSRPKLKT